MEGLISTPPQYRAGYIALVGEPNAGKSTLLNALLGQKISIVTPKPQTTRHKILGILTTRTLQAVFLDTPGLIAPRYALHRAMMRQAEAALNEADIVLFLVDTLQTTRRPDDPIPEAVRATNKPVYLILNKVDCVSDRDLGAAREALGKRFSFHRILPVSGLRGTGIPQLLEGLASDMPVHPPYYPDDVASDRQERFFVAEIIREKIFVLTHDEIPYAATVDIVDFKEREKGKWFISADIVVERASQKGIVIGKGGAHLKEIGRRARSDIEAFLQNPVFLDLHVKVREGWRENEEWVKRLGYRDDR